MRNRVLIRNRWCRTLLITAWIFLAVCGWRGTAAASDAGIRFTVDRFEVTGENPLSAEETRAVLEPFQGEHFNLAGLEAAAMALEDALKEKGWAFHRVHLPPQQIKSAVVMLSVSVVRVTHVTVEGNTHFPADNIYRSLPQIEEGNDLNTKDTARALRLANTHPAKQVALQLKPGQEKGTLDATVRVEDTPPQKIYATLSNTGDSETGEIRLGVGYQYSNLFNRDHTATLSYTTSPENIDRVTQVGFHYRMPLYRWYGGISLFATHSQVDQGTVAEFFDVSGKGTFGGISADVALRPVGYYTHKLTAGLQLHRFENDTTFDSEAIGTDVTSCPFSIRYDGRLEKKRSVAGFYLEVAANIGAGSNNDGASYEASRPGADVDWMAFRYGADLEWTLPERWRIRARWNGQYAADPLISGEQFGLGGPSSVRGFDSRVVAGESGQQISTEIWLPPILSGVQFLGFCDVGWLQVQEPLTIGPDNEFLAAAGMGLRWVWHTPWSHLMYLQLDAAHVLDDAATVDSGSGKVHFNVYYRF